MLYALTSSINNRCDHDFSCINEDLIEEFKTIKPQLNCSSKSSQLENKLHMINDTLITYGISLIVYVIQKKFRILNLTDQEKRTRKTELTSCVSKHFNSMCVVRALNENSFGRNFTPAYIFIDCPVSKEYCKQLLLFK